MRTAHCTDKGSNRDFFTAVQKLLSNFVCSFRADFRVKNDETFHQGFVIDSRVIGIERHLSQHIVSLEVISSDEFSYVADVRSFERVKLRN